jgi:hypothetical protein
MFEEFYKNEFQEIKNVCGFSENSAKAINALKKKDKRIILARRYGF